MYTSRHSINRCAAARLPACLIYMRASTRTRRRCGPAPGERGREGDAEAGERGARQREVEGARPNADTQTALAVLGPKRFVLVLGSTGGDEDTALVEADDETWDG